MFLVRFPVYETLSRIVIFDTLIGGGLLGRTANIVVLYNVWSPLVASHGLGGKCTVP
jgi:hypothetical protein